MERQKATPIRRLGLPLAGLLLAVLAFWAWRLVTLITEVGVLQTERGNLQNQIGLLTKQRDRLSAEELVLKRQNDALKSEASDYDVRVKEARQLLDRLGIRESDRRRINDLLDRGGKGLAEDDSVVPRVLLVKLQGLLAGGKLRSPDLHLLRVLYPTDAELVMLNIDALVQEGMYLRLPGKRRQLLVEAHQIGEAALPQIRQGNAALAAGMKGRMGVALSALADQQKGEDSERTRRRALELFEFAMENAGAARRNDWYLSAVREKRKVAGGVVTKDVADYACDVPRMGGSQVRMNNCATFLSIYSDSVRKSAPSDAADAACRAAALFRPINEDSAEDQKRWFERVKDKCNLLRKAAGRQPG